MNLKEFSRQYTGNLQNKLNKNIEKTSGKTISQVEQELKKEHQTEYKEAKDIYSKYSGMNEQELTKELFSVAQEQKQNGTFDEEQIRNTYQMLSPMLTNEQRQKIESLMGKII